MAALWALRGGAIAPWLPESTPVWDVHNVLIGSLLTFAWVRYDADARGRHTDPGRSRTLARVLLALPLSVLILIGLMVLTLADALASLAAGGGLE